MSYVANQVIMARGFVSWVKNVVRAPLSARQQAVILRFGSSNHIFFELYVNSQVIGHEKFISDVKINIGAAVWPVRLQSRVSLWVILQQICGKMTHVVTSSYQRADQNGQMSVLTTEINSLSQSVCSLMYRMLLLFLTMPTLKKLRILNIF